MGETEKRWEGKRSMRSDGEGMVGEMEEEWKDETDGMEA